MAFLKIVHVSDTSRTSHWANPESDTTLCGRPYEYWDYEGLDPTRMPTCSRCDRRRGARPIGDYIQIAGPPEHQELGPRSIADSSQGDQ